MRVSVHNFSEGGRFRYPGVPPVRAGGIPVWWSGSGLLRAARVRQSRSDRGRRRAELRLLGGALEGAGGGVAAADRLEDLVEVGGAYLALVAGGGVSVALGIELR